MQKYPAHRRRWCCSVPVALLLGGVLDRWADAGIKFPYGTLIVNLTACVIIGFSMTYLSRRAELSPAWRFLIPVGFIGAYSTFSTYEWETLTSLPCRRLCYRGSVCNRQL